MTGIEIALAFAGVMAVAVALFLLMAFAPEIAAFVRRWWRW